MKKVRFFMSLLAAVALLATVGCEPVPTPDGGEGDGTEQTPGEGDGGNVDIDPTPAQNFAITVSEITGSCAKVEVTPAIMSTYYFDVVECAEYNSYADPMIFINEIIAEIEEILELYEALLGEQLSLKEFLSQGKATWYYTCDLDPQTDYYVFAAGISGEGDVTTDVETESFKTIAPQMSSNTFSVAVEDELITVSPSIANEYYLCSVYYTEELNGLSDSEILAGIIEEAKEWGIEYYVGGYGMNEFDYTGSFENGDDLTVCVFGYDGIATTGLTKYRFVYESANGGGSNDWGLELGDSSLNKDLTRTAVEIYAGDYGDYYYTNTRNLYFELLVNDTEFAFFECFTPLNATGVPVGKMAVSSLEALGSANTVMPGCMDEEGYLLGSWWVTVDGDGNLNNYAGAISGELSIEQSGSNYNLVFAFKDAGNHTVKISYTGAIEVLDETGYGMAAVSTGARLYKSHSGKQMLRPAKRVQEHKSKQKPMLAKRKPSMKVAI